jgi:glutamate carboxypeptidase
MDTVYGQEVAFQKCRWDGEHRLNGPGVADAKGGLVVMLYALRALEASPLAGKLGWEVIINPDEEIGSVGSGEFLAQRAGQADLGLLFEPSLPDGTLVSTRKGTGNFEFVFRGRSAHSGREFEKGRNAIVSCCKMMNEIWHLNGKTQTTYNVGRISGGGALNIVPELAIGRVNVRVSSAEEQREAERLLGQLVENYNSQEGALEGISVEQYGKFTSPPKELTPEIEKLQRRIEECGRLLDIPVAWQSTGGACDGNKFAAAGLPNIDTLGPQGGEIHSPSEYLLTDTLVPRAKLAALVLMSLASE